MCRAKGWLTGRASIITTAPARTRATLKEVSQSAASRYFNITIILQLGKQCMYKKGQFLRQQYNGFLSELYMSSEILAQSTKIGRTIMSAKMVLAGLYPPKQYQKWSNTVWQPIPVFHDSPDHGLVSIYLLVPTCVANIYILRRKFNRYWIIRQT